jgi:CBS domain containing-hemolysin-like protein
MLAVRDANQHLGLELPENGSYTTIAGFLLAKAGRVLKPGEKVEDTAGVFQVERVEKRRISRIRFVPGGVMKASQSLYHCFLLCLESLH